MVVAASGSRFPERRTEPWLTHRLQATYHFSLAAAVRLHVRIRYAGKYLLFHLFVPTRSRSMSQTPDPEQPSRQPRHPEVFHDPDAGQAGAEDNRRPEDFMTTQLRKGCIWAIVLFGALLLVIALIWKLVWDEAPPEAMDPTERERPAAETEPDAPIGVPVIGDEPDEMDERDNSEP